MDYLPPRNSPHSFNGIERIEFYVPEVLIAARAMKGGMAILRPILAEKNIKGIGTVILGTAKGDLHDIGEKPGRNDARRSRL